MSQIQWMTPGEFGTMYASSYQPVRAWLDQEMSAAVVGQDLRANIAIEGAVNPTDGGDEPGPCVRWYGRADDLLFFITHYETQDYSILTTRRASQGYTWSVLSQLSELRWFWTQLTWLRSFNDAAPKNAVCRTDRWGVRFQVYQSDDQRETEALLAVLGRISSNVNVFYECQPDPVDSDWAIYDVDRKLLGRHTRRDSTERAARRMSEKLLLELSVVEEPSGRVWSRWKSGHIMIPAVESS